MARLIKSLKVVAPLVLVAAALSGCVYYPAAPGYAYSAPAYYGPAYYGPAYYGPPVSVGVGFGGGWGGRGRWH